MTRRDPFPPVPPYWNPTKIPYNNLLIKGSCNPPTGQVKQSPMIEQNDDLKAEIARLKLENQALKRTSAKGLSFKVSEKGALSVYGLGRFPVTLYKEQWNRLLDTADDIRAFIKTNEALLKTKE